MANLIITHRNSFFCLVILFVGVLSAAGQGHRFRLVEYNVENLFDTIHAEGRSDLDFTPNGIYHWDTRKYWHKLRMLSATIAGLGGTMPADLVALCEVEGENVLKDLVRHTSLRRLGYEYLITQSKDPRGVNVALLYQPLRFRPFKRRDIHVDFNAKKERPTRDILYISGIIPTGDTLDVFVCHLPSRSGGAKSSSKYRERAARAIYQEVCALRHFRSRPNIVITGDFNDEYTDLSIRKSLQAKPMSKVDASRADSMQLVVLSANRKTDNGIEGSYKFQGRWNQLDQIIVNARLLRADQPFYTSDGDCRIGYLPYLCEPDDDGFGLHPRRTYLGSHYHGGLSDHLPMICDFFY